MVGPIGLGRGLTLSLPHSWDESSSISSGLSDASDNLSSEEFNASSSLNSLPSTPTASRRNSAIAVGASGTRTLPSTYPSLVPPPRWERGEGGCQGEETRMAQDVCFILLPAG